MEILYRNIWKYNFYSNMDLNGGDGGTGLLNQNV